MNTIAILGGLSISSTPPLQLRRLTISVIAVVHNRLGKLYADVGKFDEAVNQFEEAIRCNEKAGHLFEAGKVRLGAALVLGGTEHTLKAQAFVRTAQDNFMDLDEREWIQSCQQVISRLESPVKPSAMGEVDEQ